MKKIKNKHSKKMRKLIPHIRKIMKDLAKYIASPMEAMLKPGLSSLFSSCELPSTIKSLIYTDYEPNDAFRRATKSELTYSELTYTDRVNIELNKISKKYKKICVLKLYEQIREEDFYNYCVNNYKFNPRKKIEGNQ